MPARLYPIRNGQIVGAAYFQSPVSSGEQFKDEIMALHTEWFPVLYDEAVGVNSE